MEPGTKRARTDAWVRPPAPLAPRAVLFQCMAIEELDDVVAPELAFPSGAASLILYGVTDADNSVAVHIHGFMPYFWVRAPVDYTPKHAESFRLSLESMMVSGDAEWKRKFAIGSVVRVDFHYRASIMGYTENLRQPFLRITMSKPRNVATARQACIAGFPLAYRRPSDPLFQCETFESNVEYPLRYMIDKGIAGAAWVELPGFTQRVGRGKMTHCQIEVDAPFDGLVAHHYDVHSHIAPLRILSFDIECAGRPGIFPEAETDPVIQIACYVTRQGENKPFVGVVFTLLRCAHIAHATVLSYETEEELLAAFQRFVVGTDPDILTGYNIVNFDIPYLINRAAKLNVKMFPYLGRQKAVVSKVSESRFSSKAYGTRMSKITNISGRVALDGMIVVQRDYKLRSYTLNSVSFHFLQESKEDVHHSMITTLQNESDDTRRRLAVYCLKDALLPQRLMDKLMFLVNYIEQARVCGVPIDYLLSRGQQIKVFSQLLRKALQRGYLVPYNKSVQTDEKYTGATVIEPDRGYYSKPITTLDFSSLYPSIMMAHNLCYSTLGATANAADFTHTPNGDDFVKPAVRKGVLPEILEELITTRTNVKRMMKVEKDPFRYAVLDGRQLALKISANSVYGFTGATLGKLPCLAISSSVTAFGREMIEQTKVAVQERYRVEKGYKYDARVIYGDTDSVMILFGNETVAECMVLGAEAAAFVNELFIKPINLEFEKVYFPYLLITKKRYAGLYWTKPDKWDKLDCKGIESTRRDNCLLVKNVIDHVLRMLLVEKDAPGAMTHVKKVISELCQNRVDLSLLVISKSFAREVYVGKQPHVELVKKMRARDPATAPNLGDRVPYVVIRGDKKMRTYEKVEDPMYVLENNLQIDFEYYLQNQLAKPLTRLFEPILREKVTSLLAGDHTRTIAVVTPVNGMSRFLVKRDKCLGCKCLVPDRRPLCDSCSTNGTSIYLEQLQKQKQIQREFHALQVNCQNCQGSRTNEIICSNRDCMKFYRSKRSQRDAQSMAETMARFEW